MDILIVNVSRTLKFLSWERSEDDSGGRESAYSAGDPGSIPGSGRSPGEHWCDGTIYWPKESRRQVELKVS